MLLNCFSVGSQDDEYDKKGTFKKKIKIEYFIYYKIKQQIN